VNDQLNREEREILEKFNRGELHPVTDVEGEMTTARQAARNTLKMPGKETGNMSKTRVTIDPEDPGSLPEGRADHAVLDGTTEADLVSQQRDDDAEAMSDVARSAGFKVPNAETLRAMAECEEMMRRGTARFANAEEMFAELERHGSTVVAVPREGRPVLTAAEVEETSAGLRSGAPSASGTQGVG